ncbi:hypothetical protein HHUSO_G31313 [Huso huso]|uniref:Ig-like domain-containing protein n=1 Tax=Huso huso TaxID=61971 RepID=A0ABR0YD47_HUSHU
MERNANEKDSAVAGMIMNKGSAALMMTPTQTLWRDTRACVLKSWMESFVSYQRACPSPDLVAVSGSAGGRAVLPCSYTPTPRQDVEVRWEAYSHQGKSVVLITSKTSSAPISAQWSGRVKLSDEVSSGNASLLISELRLEDTLDYTCTVGINGICFTYRSVKLTVQGPPKRDSTTSGTTTTTTPTTRPSATPAILSAVAISAVIGIIGAAVFVILKYKRRAANANGNNQNAGDHNASSDLLTYAVVDHTRQPGGAPVRSGVSAVDNGSTPLSGSTDRTRLTQPPGIQESFNNKINQGFD